MAQPTRKGQKVIVYNDPSFVFIVESFLGAKQKALHNNIEDALKEDPSFDRGKIAVNWRVDGRLGTAKVKTAK
jgi:hypothetical protein